jgi:hypothetical protein
MRQRKTQLGSGRQVAVHVPKRVNQNPLFRLPDLIRCAELLGPVSMKDSIK